MHNVQESRSSVKSIYQQRFAVEESLRHSVCWYGCWLLGVPVFTFGAADRVVSTLITNSTEVSDNCYCMTALVLLIGWLCMGLETQSHQQSSEIQAASSTLPLLPEADCIAQQSYTLPFPYRCQIYHLLNLKHLEDVHQFSLGNLKVMGVSHFHKSQSGGLIRFKTVLDSRFNVLRLWRQNSVDVDLILHNPYQIELKVPIYRHRFLHVLFNVIPLNSEEHQLVIQMFSDLQWPKDLQRVILLLASSLTLLEDLPYLNQLATRNVVRSPQMIKHPTRLHAMQLFQRYVDLYGAIKC